MVEEAPLKEEVDIQDRILRVGQPRVSFPRQVSQQFRLPVGPPGMDLVGGRLGLRDRFSLGQLFGDTLEKYDQLFDRPRQIGEEIARLEEQAVQQDPQVLLENLRREDLPRAVRQVVRLVDDEDDLLELLADQMPKRDSGLEDVVVISDNRVRALRKLELNLEGADLFAPRLLEDGTRIQMWIR